MVSTKHVRPTLLRSSTSRPKHSKHLQWKNAPKFGIRTLWIKVWPLFFQGVFSLNWPIQMLLNWTLWRRVPSGWHMVAIKDAWLMVYLFISWFVSFRRNSSVLFSELAWYSRRSELNRCSRTFWSVIRRTSPLEHTRLRNLIKNPLEHKRFACWELLSISSKESGKFSSSDKVQTLNLKNIQICFCPALNMQSSVYYTLCS